MSGEGDMLGEAESVKKSEERGNRWAGRKVYMKVEVAHDNKF
jgi:hypothetical protein